MKAERMEEGAFTGFTAYMAFGKYGGWRIGFDGPSLMMTFGRVSIRFIFYDLELAMETIINRSLEVKEVLSEWKI